MAMAYWVITYLSIKDKAAFDDYAKVVEPMVRNSGGRAIIRGMPIATQEAGLFLRTTVIEFNGLDKAIAAYQNPAYKAALKIIQGKVEREFRIFQGLEPTPESARPALHA